MARVDRVAACLIIAFLIVEPCRGLDTREALAADGQQIEGAADNVAGWILRLFRGVDDDTTRSKSGNPGEMRDRAGSSDQDSGVGSDGGDSDDGGGDDGGGDDGGGGDNGDD